MDELRAEDQLLSNADQASSTADQGRSETDQSLSNTDLGLFEPGPDCGRWRPGGCGPRAPEPRGGVCLRGRPRRPRLPDGRTQGDPAHPPTDGNRARWLRGPTGSSVRPSRRDRWRTGRQRSARRSTRAVVGGCPAQPSQALSQRDTAATASDAAGPHLGILDALSAPGADRLV